MQIATVLWKYLPLRDELPDPRFPVILHSFTSNCPNEPGGSFGTWLGAYKQFSLSFNAEIGKYSWHHGVAAAVDQLSTLSLPSSDSAVNASFLFFIHFYHENFTTLKFSDLHTLLWQHSLSFCYVGIIKLTVQNSL